MTLDEFIENNKVINMKAFAQLVGMNYTTFRALRENKLYVTPERKKEHIDHIEKELHKLAEELRKIKFIIE